MVYSKELIGTTEYLTLYVRCRINRCRYNRVQIRGMGTMRFPCDSTDFRRVRNIEKNDNCLVMPVRPQGTTRLPLDGFL